MPVSNSQKTVTPSQDSGRSGGTCYPEPCPTPDDFQVGGCQDAVNIRLTDVNLQSLGRIVQVDATIHSVCPGKPLAAAIILTEEDENGVEHPRGMKTMAIPAQGGTQCQDLTLRCIPFVVPEALDTAGTPGSICEARKFRARVLANYTDTDYICCDSTTAIV